MENNQNNLSKERRSASITSGILYTIWCVYIVALFVACLSLFGNKQIGYGVAVLLVGLVTVFMVYFLIKHLFVMLNLLIEYKENSENRIAALEKELAELKAEKKDGE